MKSNLPVMPEDMHPRCKKWWRRIMKEVDRSVLLPCDVYCLQMASTNCAIFEKMAKDIKQKGRNKVIYLDDKKMLSDWEKILTMSFDQLLLSREARNDLMKHMAL